MDIIHLLPDSVANQIAAGEVIQRPASVIKELVENSVDAGARNIDVHVWEAGRSCIQIIDDGKGMSETDARLAFERHATSKITRAEDLFTLRTMGFRGEALPSIVAVAQVTLQTRTHEKELGTRIEIEGGRVLNQEPCVCPIGANFEVRNLFFNIPARRKFLKSNHTELNNIIQEFERIALVNHSVGFTLTSDGTTTIRLMASNMRRRIVDLYGKKIGEDLVAVDAQTSLVNIEGFVGRPESSRKKGAHQYFFVNGRYMRHPYFAKAVASAFDKLVPDGDQVHYFLYLTIDPANIDVNISPTKTEVKFENEQAIWQIINAAIKESLGKFNAVPSIDFENALDADIPVMDTGKANIEPPRINIDHSYNPFGAKTSQSYSPTYENGKKSQTSYKEWAELYNQLLPGNQKNNLGEGLFPDEQSEKTEELCSAMFQYHGKYIISATSAGLMIINQRRAHVRVLYEKYITQMRQQENATQGLLFPELLSLSTANAIVLRQITDDLKNIGFDIIDIGGSSFSINGLPSGTEGLNPQKLIQEIISSVQEGEKASLDNHKHNIAMSLAKAAAIVEGEVLTNAEMESLLADLLKSTNPNVTPDGQTIIAKLAHNSIEKMFT